MSNGCSSLLIKLNERNSFSGILKVRTKSMGFFSRFGWGQRENLFLALDIGTEVVKALVFRVDSETRTGQVIGVGRAPQRVGNMQSGAVSDINGVILSSREAIELAKEHAQVKHVEKVSLVLLENL